VPKGVDVPNLDRHKEWTFEKYSNKEGKQINVRKGDIINGGDIFGQVYENNLFSKHCIMVPPNYGALRVVEEPDYGVQCTITKGVVKVEDERGKVFDLNLYHTWPVRRPRPCHEKLQGDQPL